MLMEDRRLSSSRSDTGIKSNRCQIRFDYFLKMVVCLMVFNATFNNISVILWQSVLLVEET